jgi:membrane protein
MATARAPRPLSHRLARRIRSTVDLWVDCFDRNDLLNSASAIALRALVSLIPLALLGLALLGAFGLEDVWKSHIAPALQAHFTPSVYRAMATSVQKIFAADSAGLIAFAALLSIWDVSSCVRACMNAMTKIYNQRDDRSIWKRFGISIGIGIGIALCVIGAVLVVFTIPRLSGAAVLLGIVRWAASIGLLVLAVGLLVHFAPFRRRSEEWVGLGTILIVATWVVASFIFKWFVTSVANFKSATGILAFFLVLTSYVYTSSIIFLIGVQLDELLRKDASRHNEGILTRLRGLRR